MRTRHPPAVAAALLEVGLAAAAPGQCLEDAKLLAFDGAPGDQFGSSVAVSADGQTVLIGAPGNDAEASNAGAAYVFTRSGPGWQLQAKLVAEDATQSSSALRAAAPKDSTEQIRERRSGGLVALRLRSRHAP